MTAQTRSTLKAVFEDGDVPQGSDYTDLIDSFLSLTNTTAQAITSPLEITVSAITYTNVAGTTLTTAQTSAVFSQTGQGAHKVLTLRRVTVDGSSYYMPFFHIGSF